MHIARKREGDTHSVRERNSRRDRREKERARKAVQRMKGG